jgi:hypothetical protein
VLSRSGFIMADEEQREENERERRERKDEGEGGRRRDIPVRPLTPGPRASHKRDYNSEYQKRRSYRMKRIPHQTVAERGKRGRPRERREGMESR